MQRQRCISLHLHGAHLWEPAPTVASITVANGSVQVRGVSRPGTCFALISRRGATMPEAEIEALADASFVVPAL